MFDVVPPRQPARPARLSRPRIRSRPAGAGGPQAVVQPERPRVVRLEWRLPSRLRRPVRDELARTRRAARRQKAIVSFERRPIHSSLPTTHPAYRGGPAAPRNVGSEHHTGDVYMHSRPEVQLPTPPYRGGFLRPAATPSRRVAARAPLASHSEPRAVPPQRPVPSPHPTAPQRLPRRTLLPQPMAAPPSPSPAFPAFTDVRDVPYAFASPSTPLPTATPELPATPRTLSAITKPRRRFAWPLHVSLIPTSLRPPRRPEVTLAHGKKKLQLHRPQLRSGVLLLVGCAVAAGLIGLLQHAGQGYAALGSITGRARTALTHVTAAQAALAETDFGASATSFAAAEAEVTAARTELQDALSVSQHILRYLDITGTVRSGDELLVAGAELSRAGQHLATALGRLSAVQPQLDGTSETPTLVDALTGMLGELQSAEQALAAAEAALGQVDSALLPDDIVTAVAQLKETVPRVRQVLATILAQSDTLLSLLGADADRQYLIVFQNNHELRPTGGFIGSLALVNVDRGVVEDIDVQSVYDPDGQLKTFIAPPAPLLPITSRWYLRDANWFVDWRVSGAKIADFFEKEGGPTVDGVIAMTPAVITELLEITGPITMSQYGVTVDAENFVAETQDQVTYSYDPELNRPKQFLADLAPVLLSRIFQAPPESRVRVLRSLDQLIRTKDILLYARDEDVAQALYDARWDGSLPPAAQGFLSINNANIGGHKSDQFMEQEIDYRTEVSPDGDAEVVLTVRRTHRGPDEARDIAYPEGEDPAEKVNVVWQRVLVPREVELLDASGFTAAAEVPRLAPAEFDVQLQADGEVAEWQRQQRVHSSGTTVGVEAGYTYFGNWVVTRPGETTVTLYKYRLPRHATLPSVLNPAEAYQVYVSKQPGEARTMLRVAVRLPEAVEIVHTVPHDGITIEGSSVVYRGGLASDTMVGAVLAPRP